MNITIGASIFSFSDAWMSRRFSLDDMIGKVAALGVGPGIEIVGFQSIRGFPHISAEFAAHFRGLVERLGLTPTCLGGNIDVGRYTGRMLTPEEVTATVEQQIAAAQQLGFPVLRIQLVSQEVLESVLPLAERAGIHLACEVHAPLTPAHPAVMAVRELCDRTQSPHLGLVLDFSCSMLAPPEGFWQQLRWEGAGEDLIDAAKAIWHSDGPPPEKFGALAAAGREHGASPALMGSLNLVLTMFGRMPVADYRAALPYSRHLHGKFYHVDESGNEPSIPYPQIFDLLQDCGFSGSISAECEGSAFSDARDADPDGEFGEVSRWHAMVERLVGRAA